jgi:DNA replication protein DnaC
MLVILDELGYLPFSQAGGALLFHLLSKLYEHKRGDHDQPGLRRMVDGGTL